jgi:hypothetical protein
MRNADATTGTIADSVERPGAHADVCGSKPSDRACLTCTGLACARACAVRLGDHVGARNAQQAADDPAQGVQLASLEAATPPRMSCPEADLAGAGLSDQTAPLPGKGQGPRRGLQRGTALAKRRWIVDGRCPSTPEILEALGRTTAGRTASDAKRPATADQRAGRRRYRGPAVGPRSALVCGDHGWRRPGRSRICTHTPAHHASGAQPVGPDAAGDEVKEDR